MFGFGKAQNKNREFEVALFDCRTSRISRFNASPSKLGLSCGLDGFNGDFAEISVGNDGVPVFSPMEGFSPIINSAPVVSPVALRELVTLQVGDALFYLASGADAVGKLKDIDTSRWIIFYAESGRIEDEVPFERLKSSVLAKGLSGVGMAFCPRNFELGFMFSSVFGDSVSPKSHIEIPLAAESSSAVTCPLCWLKFDVGDVLSIATHESLRSDPILGPDEMLRFLPTAFNEDGIALDPAGMPAPDMACPHCRKRLPPSFLDLDQRIFSIVGAPSSGKSYYLSVLVHELQRTLYQKFNIVMKDLDPSGNMLLTQMKNRLFSSKSPEDAILAKTPLEGSMYERYPRFGKMVALPKPMAYSLSLEGHSETSMIFYDNAGEHFEPGLDIEESPGAMHVASSAALFFLFDPASSMGFKRVLGDYPDPQLSIYGRLDQQDTILAEMEVRIKRILAIEASKKISTPLAIIIGKGDMWTHLLDKKLKNPVVDGKLDLSIVDENSALLRKFLLSIDSSVSSVADSISENVRYFALSALGHSPCLLKSGPFAGKIAPIPEKLNPIDVEYPTIWALSQCTDLIPVK